MDKDLEIIKIKLNIMFNEIMNIKQELLAYKGESRLKEAEYKLERAQDELASRKDNIRWDMEYLSKDRDHFYDIDREISKKVEEIAIERL